MSAKRRTKPNPFSRRPQSPGSTGKTILIVTEGEKTEPNYLKGLRNHLKLQAADIRVVKADGTDALSVVKHAVELRGQRRREARRGCTVPYDSVWAVFDTERADTNLKLNDALQKATAHKINVALSNPCFEFWVLLHDEYTTAQFTKCENVIRRIKDRHFPDYEKGNVNAEQYLPKIPTAIRNSEQCREYHKTAGVDGNPSTDVDLLVREMNDATRKHYRLNLETNEGVHEQDR